MRIKIHSASSEELIATLAPHHPSPTPAEVEFTFPSRVKFHTPLSAGDVKGEIIEVCAFVTFTFWKQYILYASG